MKTALVTTCWLDTDEYLKKTIKWVNYVSTFGLPIYLLDNNSSSRNKEILKINSSTDYIMISFSEHLGRKSHLEYMYAWRAIFYFKELFDAGYEKIISCDVDFFVLSEHMLTWMDKATGWSTPWCSKHNFPETAFQVITKDCQNYWEFIKTPMEQYNHKQMEDILPLTTIDKTLIGDRYSEYGPVVQNETMDFMAQTLVTDFPLFGLKKST